MTLHAGQAIQRGKVDDTAIFGTKRDCLDRPPLEHKGLPNAVNCYRMARPLNTDKIQRHPIWLLTIVRNTCYRWLSDHRDKRNVVAFDEALHSVDITPVMDGTSSVQPAPETIVAACSDSDLIAAALQTLPLVFR